MPRPKKSIPERWLPYKSIGNKVPHTRFIAFKVPLKEEVCQDLPEDQRFTLQHLVENVKKLGLIIDLTNTNRYYNAVDLQKWNIQYSKIYVEGKKVPNSFIVNQFFTVVDDFLQNRSNKGKLIGVHCTHGLNRTGYLVCRYMVDKMNKTPDDAVNAFNEARGHCIERPAYIRGLQMDAAAAEKLQVEDHRHGANPVPRPQYYRPHSNFPPFENNGFLPNRRPDPKMNYGNNSRFHPYLRPQYNVNESHIQSRRTSNVSNIRGRSSTYDRNFRGRRNYNYGNNSMNLDSNYHQQQGNSNSYNWRAPGVTPQAEQWSYRHSYNY
uniref:Uncharacterized protein n=1 Tax=Strigamia maritima TaxID=126957 RepID=T1IQI5_STRMM